MNELLKRLFVVSAIIIGLLLLSLGEGVSRAKQEMESANKLNWLWPTQGELTDVYGARSGSHHGIDIAAEVGKSVIAAESGRVIKSYYSHSYGHVIFIQHQHEVETVYAHLHKRLVAEGDFVHRGEKIGEVGNTGRSSGSHLHFEIHDGEWNIYKSNSINPLYVLGEQGEGDRFAKVEEAIETTGNSEGNKYSYIKREVITVQEGDTLWGFSQKYNIPIEEIKKWNELDSSLILVDQTLVIHIFDKM